MKKLVTLCAFVAISTINTNAFSDASIAEVKEIKNSVQISRISSIKKRLENKKLDWQAVDKDSKLFYGDRLRTGLRSTIKMVYNDGSITKLGSRSNIEVGHKRVNVKRGFIWGKFNKQNDGSYKFLTPTASATIISTEFFVETKADNSSCVVVVEGEINVDGLKNSEVVKTGTCVNIDNQGNVSAPMVFNLEDKLKLYPDVAE